MGFLALSGRESSLVQTFCESCVHLDITHPSVHMARRFVIQGCPTIKEPAKLPQAKLVKVSSRELEKESFVSSWSTSGTLNIAKDARIF